MASGVSCGIKVAPESHNPFGYIYYNRWGERSKTPMTQIGKYNFDGPWLLSRTDLIDRAAVYVILCSRVDGKYDVVYVGETGQAGTRLSNHERAACWSRNCGGTLYVAVFWTPSDRYTADDRRKIEKELRDQYNPPCNRQ